MAGLKPISPTSFYSTLVRMIFVREVQPRHPTISQHFSTIFSNVCRRHTSSWRRLSLSGMAPARSFGPIMQQLLTL